MRKRVKGFLFLSILLLLIAFSQQQIMSSGSDGHSAAMRDTLPSIPEPAPRPLEIQKVIDEYDTWLKEEIEISGTVGAAVAIVYKDRVAYSNCFGVRKAGEPAPIDEHTVFRLASVSKAVTGVLAGILDSEGTIHLDDKVVEYIPGFRLKNPGSTTNLSIRNLLSHTTGLVPHAYDNMVEGKVPMGIIMQRLAEVDVSAQPGTLYGYQNVMFSLIDTILRAKTARNYGELLHEKVFEPYGMNDATTDFESFKNNPNKAYPHARGNGSYWSQQLNDRYYSTAPAAGVNASLADMTSFLKALLNKKEPVVSPQVHQAVFTPQVNSHLSRSYFRNWDRVDSKQYAIGWRIVGYKGRKVAYHGGYVNGYKAEIALCENENVGIVFLTNSPNSMATKTVPEFLGKLFEFQDTRRILTNAEESGLANEG
ncbi:MAG: serine hydrolase domain-containing protein [Tangfeifania sp.]